MGDVQPGLKVVFSRKGLDYAAKEAIQTLTADVVGKPIADQNGERKEKLGKVKWELRGMHVTKFEEPFSELTVNPGHGITWFVRVGKLAVHGRWKYKAKALFDIRDDGSFDVTAKGTSLKVVVAVGESDGKPTTQMTSCESDIDDLSIKFHGGASWLYNIFTGPLEGALKRSLKDLMVKAATKSVNEDVTKQLSRLRFVVPVMKVLELDYGLLGPPEFTADYVASKNKGQVCWKEDKTTAPIQPCPMPDLPQTKMMTLMLSDYVMNSMGYILHQHDKLQIYVTKDKMSTDKKKDMLNTTCTADQKVCLGNFLPQVATKYPDCSLEIDINSSEPPTLDIKESGVKCKFAGAMTVYVQLKDNTRDTLFSVKSDLTFNLKLYVEGVMLKTAAEDFTSNFKVTDSQIGQIYDQAVEFLFSLAAKKIIVPKLNKMEFELLNLDSIEFVDPTLEYYEGTVVLSTDIRYDPALHASKKQKTDENL